MQKAILNLVLLFVAVLGSVCVGQNCPTCPPGYYCPPDQVQQFQETSVLNWYQRLTYAAGVTKTPALDAESASYKFRAVRILYGNSCGSGSLVGRDANSIYLISNAHVCTNRPGTVVDCESALKDLSGTEKFRATVIEGAYSSRDTTDWALLKADGKHMAGLEPIKLSIRKPDHSKPSFTWGCPRCEVPSGQVLKSIVVDGAVWKWLPASIGGQSGSSVFQRGYAHGLLTWNYSASGYPGGLGAGQYTADIYRQSRNQTNDSSVRPEGLVPVCQEPQTDLIEGYAKSEGEPSICSLGTFQDEMVASGQVLDAFVRQSGTGDLPIWGDPDASPTDPVTRPYRSRRPNRSRLPTKRTGCRITQRTRSGKKAD